MNELFLDDYALLAVAKGIQARHDVIERRGTPAEADEAYLNASWMPYKTEWSITALEENPNLNENLLMVLEAKMTVYKLRQTKNKTETSAAEREFAEILQRYEILRRITAYECRSVIIQPL
jgi:hypothetical protein